MNEDQLFRWIFTAIFLTTISISGYFRRKARKSGEVIERKQEGFFIGFIRVIFAAPLYLSILAIMFKPEWMTWSKLGLPTELRWLGTIAALAMIPFLYWVFVSIGNNISETFLTKEEHVLVVHGPYRWIRHPLYSASTITFFSLSLVADNWFLMLIALIAIGVLTLIGIPREEAKLIEKFGQEYTDYQRRTGKLFPRINLSGWQKYPPK